MNEYPKEVLSEYEDDGTMPQNVENLAQIVVGHKIVKAEKVMAPSLWYWDKELIETFSITLDNGKTVYLYDDSDCCAYTQIESFILNVDKIDHMIMGVGTTDKYETWHIYADMGDVLTMKVGWSPGNPFYYGYGFIIKVVEKELQ